MKFDLNSRWAVMTEDRQVTIARRQINQKTGAVYYSPTYYYNNMAQALDGLIDRDINELEKLEEIVERISELKSEIKTMLGSAKKTSSEASTAEIKVKPTHDKGAVNRVKRKKSDKQRLSD